MQPGRSGYVPYQPGFERKARYRQFVVPAGHPLFGIVSDFYQFDSDERAEDLCVLPDGCMDLLFRYGNGGTEQTLEGYYRVKVTVPANQAGSAFGVRFRPGGQFGVLPVPASELVGKRFPLRELMGNDPALERMERETEFRGRVAVASGFLMRRLRRGSGCVDLARYCADRIVSRRGELAVGELSGETGYTVRYLRDLFHRQIGVSPKELCGIVRFQSSFFLLSRLERSKRDFLLSDFAAEAGYYDQSHMNQCYRRLAGCLPRELFEEVGP